MPQGLSEQGTATSGDGYADQFHKKTRLQSQSHLGKSMTIQAIEGGSVCSLLLSLF